MVGTLNQQNAAHKQHRRVYFITAPRTASNLFVRILNLPGQPDAKASERFGGYFFMPVMRHRNEFQNWQVATADLPKEQADSIEAEYRNNIATYRGFLEQTEKDGKIAFIKEHAHLMVKPSLLDDLIHDLPLHTSPTIWDLKYDEETDVRTGANPTVIPDNVLHTFQPTFLIRHPALQIPSLYRAQAESLGDMDTESSRSFGKGTYNNVILRELYNFYAKHFAEVDPASPFPLVIDAADLITHPTTIMKHFCDLNGLDINACKFNWNATSKQQLEANGLEKIEQRFLSTIMASTGVLADKAGLNIDIDVEAQKWRKEFGEETGAYIEKFVRAAMPDYLYLREKRWIPKEGMEQEIADGVKKSQAAAIVTVQNVA